MAKGQVSKSIIFKKILDSFEGAFPYNNGKEIRIPMTEEGEEIQIKVTLTASKENVLPGGENSLPGETVATKEESEINFEEEPKKKLEITEEEKQNVSELLKALGL